MKKKTPAKPFDTFPWWEYPLPTTFEGEVLAYERGGGKDFMLLRVGDTMTAQRLPIPVDIRHHFDMVPSRAVHKGEHPGCTVSIDYATVCGRIDYHRVIGLRVNGRTLR